MNNLDEDHDKWESLKFIKKTPFLFTKEIKQLLCSAGKNKS